jgi:hypothetical protein
MAERMSSMLKAIPPTTQDRVHWIGVGINTATDWFCNNINLSDFDVVDHNVICPQTGMDIGPQWRGN